MYIRLNWCQVFSINKHTPSDLCYYGHFCQILEIQPITISPAVDNTRNIWGVGIHADTALRFHCVVKVCLLFFFFFKFRCIVYCRAIVDSMGSSALRNVNSISKHVNSRLHKRELLITTINTRPHRTVALNSQLHAGENNCLFYFIFSKTVTFHCFYSSTYTSIGIVPPDKSQLFIQTVQPEQC